MHAYVRPHFTFITFTFHSGHDGGRKVVENKKRVISLLVIMAGSWANKSFYD